ncbi:GNAT family N-acetyltransferase [Amnibacterium setariae]|uniref:N-acetyltransferase n=1 Tax=Amnibacterium setariae TaxID=2306585 RepID=A0A3A1TY86_9MICO|nr:GNAT family N-acetyltransferase [Amnibacterium setariae]RIX28558.1 N-acetyltransferase [Amnibacterium setariae]
MTLAAGYLLLPGAPAPEDYLRLRRESGLSPKTTGQAEAAIAGSWAFRRVETERGEVVAMGRVVGDGGWYFLVADMATLPGHQRRGIGGAVLDALLEEIRTRAEPGAYVTLTADPPGRRLYESRGFLDVAPDRTGMWRMR